MKAIILLLLLSSVSCLDLSVLASEVSHSFLYYPISGLTIYSLTKFPALQWARTAAFILLGTQYAVETYIIESLKDGGRVAKLMCNTTGDKGCTMREVLDVSSIVRTCFVLCFIAFAIYTVYVRLYAFFVTTKSPAGKELVRIDETNDEIEEDGMADVNNVDGIPMARTKSCIGRTSTTCRRAKHGKIRILSEIGAQRTGPRASEVDIKGSREIAEAA